MSEYYFSAKIEDGSCLCIAPLTDKRIELSGEFLEDASGYFLYATRGDKELSEVVILARLCSEEAAMHLRSLLKLK